MTSKQQWLYWREWRAVQEACKKQGIRLPDRHELHIKALGKDKSHKSLTNEQFDKVLAEFRALSRPASLESQLRQLRQEQTRLLWKIHNEQIPCLATCIYYVAVKQRKAPHPNVSGQWTPRDEDYTAAEGYVHELLRDRFKVATITDLSAVKHPRGKQLPNGSHEWEKSDLELLRDTLDARINDLRKEAGLTIHDMKVATPGVICTCSQCEKRRAFEAQQKQEAAHA
jgi:hypothetical protein